MICIIPARGGSQRIPNKNIRDFHGKPIIAYSIEIAKESKLFDRIIVSTDSDTIGAVALVYGAEVHERPPWLATDEIGTQEVVGAVLEDLGVDDTTDVCALYATCPLLPVGHLKDGAWVLRRYHSSIRRAEISCVYSVDPEGEPTGGFYFAPAWYFKEGLDPYVDGLGIYADDIDINTFEDWKRAEKLYEERHGHASNMA